jgi:hypothetical protein
LQAGAGAQRYHGMGWQTRGDIVLPPQAHVVLAQLMDPFTGRTVLGPVGPITILPAGAWFTIKEPIVARAQLRSGAVVGKTQIIVPPGGTVPVAAVYMVPDEILSSDLYVAASAWESRMMSNRQTLVPIPLSK